MKNKAILIAGTYANWEWLIISITSTNSQNQLLI